MIKQTIAKQGYDAQPTASTQYYAERFDRERAAKTPRSKGAWDAEHTRLGSWNTGVGAPQRNAVGYAPGQGNALFDYKRNQT